MLPVLDTPKYKTKLVSNSKEISYRPFLVKEEKILMMAETSKDTQEITTAIEQIIDNCTFGELDVANLATIDIEWLFLQIRIRSKGEETEINMRCQNIVDDVKCNTLIKNKINLKSIVAEGENDTDVIELTDTIGMKMKYPTLKTAMNALDDNNTNSLESIINCIESVYNGDEVTLIKDIPVNMMNDWIDTLTSDQIKKVNEWLNNIPSIKHDMNIKCPKCENEQNITLRGLQSFF